MKKRITALLLVTMCFLTLTGCSKNIDKMSDEELYDYLIVMDEDELTKATSNMTEDQQVRAATVLTLMDAQERQDRDDFSSDLSIPEYENTEDTEN